MGCICGVIGIDAQHTAACMMHNRFSVRRVDELDRLRAALSAAEAERDAAIKRWEDLKVERASCCDFNEQRAIAAERRLEEAREVLRGTEWSGTDENADLPACPRCGGICPEHRDSRKVRTYELHVGHFAACRLAALLASPLSPSGEPSGTPDVMREWPSTADDMIHVDDGQGFRFAPPHGDGG